MKKFYIIILLILILVGCDKKGTLETTIVFATDIHLYSNNLMSSDNVVYVKENFSSDGRVQEYDYLLFESLINEVNKLKPDFLY